jgi:hypothetical protein
MLTRLSTSLLAALAFLPAILAAEELLPEEGAPVGGETGEDILQG